VTYRPVKLADQDGLTARIEEGVEEGELVALNLGDSLTDGARVQPIMTGEADAAK
jgi:hypothetical protein